MLFFLFSVPSEKCFLNPIHSQCVRVDAGGIASPLLSASLPCLESLQHKYEKLARTCGGCPAGVGGLWLSASAITGICCVTLADWLTA